MSSGAKLGSDSGHVHRTLAPSLRMEDILRGASAGLDAWVPDEIARVSAADLDPASFERNFLHRNTPVIVEGAVLHWPAFKKWSPTFLNAECGDSNVTVSVSPNGWGDALVSLPSGHPFLEKGSRSDAAPLGPAGESCTAFVAPIEVNMRLGELLCALCPELQEPTAAGSHAQTVAPAGLPPALSWLARCRGVPYLSYQNDNLRQQLPTLAKDIGGIPCLGWGERAKGSRGMGILRGLNAAPDAVNLWIGDSRSVSVIRLRLASVYAPPLAPHRHPGFIRIITRTSTPLFVGGRSSRFSRLLRCQGSTSACMCALATPGAGFRTPGAYRPQ